jgi:hypothetical protein
MVSDYNLKEITVWTGCEIGQKQVLERDAKVLWLAENNKSFTYALLGTWRKNIVETLVTKCIRLFNLAFIDWNWIESNFKRSSGSIYVCENSKRVK